MATDILEPIESYNIGLKHKHHDNTVKYFDDLVKESKIDIEKNKKLVKEYNETLSLLNNDKKTRRRINGLKIFLIILIVALFVAGTIMLIAGISGSMSRILGIVLGIVFYIIPIALIVLLAVKIRKILKNLQEIIKKTQEKADKLLKEAWATMAPLNRLYDWNIPAAITNKDTDLIILDKYFDTDKFQYLHDKFGFDSLTDKNVSTVTVQSGSILGNPFLICKDLNQDWVNVTYEGSMVITWTETVHTKDGTRIVTRTQTLVATLTKPAPDYNYDTYVVYANDAAPDLKFYRAPSKGSNLDEKHLRKYVDKKAKELVKKEKEELMDNDPKTNFQKMGNDEFEALFGATNRNNEVQFRLLFTPLAQKNLIKLIRSKEPYGDDFHFTKDKKINYIQSLHSQSFNYRADPKIFVDYDYERARKNFIDYNDNFFKSFYFDLAPLISIPLYQQTKTKEYIYNEGFKTNTTSYEQEVLANQFDSAYFAHKECDTKQILKAEFKNKIDDTDEVNITSYGFKKIKRVEFVPRLGGDGRMHNVPVEWYEYQPVTKETPIYVTKKETSRSGFENLVNSPQFKTLMSKLSKGGAYHFERGLFAYLGIRGITKSDTINLGNAFGIKNDNVLKETLTKVERAVNKGLEEEKKLDQKASDDAKNKTGSDEQSS